MRTIEDLLLPQGLGALPSSLMECVETLAQVVAALHLSDTRPASLAAAALQAATAVQQAQDQEVRWEHAMELPHLPQPVWRSHTFCM